MYSIRKTDGDESDTAKGSSFDDKGYVLHERIHILASFPKDIHKL